MVDVYQLMLNILGLRSPHPHNGTWEHVKDMLDDGWQASNPRADDYQDDATRCRYYLSFIVITIALSLFHITIMMTI